VAHGKVKAPAAMREWALKLEAKQFPQPDPFRVGARARTDPRPEGFSVSYLPMITAPPAVGEAWA
jgi:hypothetical protein